MFAPLTHAGGVDEEKLLIFLLVRNIDGVARCSRESADNGTLALQNRIDERGFPGIRPTDDGDFERIRADGGLSILGLPRQKVDKRLKQF